MALVPLTCDLTAKLRLFACGYGIMIMNDRIPVTPEAMLSTWTSRACRHYHRRTCLIQLTHRYWDGF
jgi:hypothetical protein